MCPGFDSRSSKPTRAAFYAPLDSRTGRLNWLLRFLGERFVLLSSCLFSLSSRCPGLEGSTTIEKPRLEGHQILCLLQPSQKEAQIHLGRCLSACCALVRLNSPEADAEAFAAFFPRNISCDVRNG